MKKTTKVLSLLLAGCMFASFTSCGKKPENKDKWADEFKDPLSVQVANVPLTYTLSKADFDKYKELLATCEKLTLKGTDVEAIEKAWDDLLTQYYHIASESNVAYIMYCSDMSNEELTRYYQYSSTMSGEAYSRYVDLCVKIYKSNSPYKDTFFEGWSQEEINDILSYSDEVSELRDDNDNIIVEFRKLDSEEAGFNQKAADFYKQLVLNNNKIARHFKDKNGDTYANYYDYAYDNVYVRDYGETELTQMRQYVGQYIVPLFGDVLSKYQQTSAKLTFEDKRLISAFEDKKYSANDIVEGYWNSYIDSFTGSMKEGLNHMFENNNCAFVSKGDCYQGAYTTTIYDTNQPFCYFGKGYQNIATVAHEVGHYYAGLYEEGSLMYDLAETHSQGNEWMLMSYLEDAMAADGYSEAYKALYYWQMVNQLYVIIVGTIIDHYESKVYALSDDVLENFTSASFDSLMTDVCTAYGGITTINTVTDIQAYWRSVCLESPVYYISYATSALASLSLYTAIETDMAAGREIYRKIVEEVDYTTGFLGNLEAVGLASPFEQSAYTNLRTLINSK